MPAIDIEHVVKYDLKKKVIFKYLPVSEDR